MQTFESSSPTAATEGFLDSFTDGDVSGVTPEEMLFYAAQAAMEVCSATQKVPIVVGYRHLPHLTERHLEILELLNTGKSPKHVREQLVIAKKTMETHMSRIHKELGTSWYREAVREARKIGILTCPASDVV